jgi:peptidoglycan/xylan/chitin deacetylase (PgdA/CDA1 family)
LRMGYQLLTWTIAECARGRARSGARIVYDWVRARLKKSDVFWNLDRLLAIEEKYKVPATYFFLHQRPMGSWWDADSIPVHYGLYSFCDPEVQALVREVHRCGGEIGIHGSLGSARNRSYFEEELQLLEAAGAPRARVARQHWLDFELWDTVETLDAARIQVDSSIGFNSPGWGFRMRTAWPHRLPRAREDRLSNVLHVTPCLQDGAVWPDWQRQLTSLLTVAKERRATLAVIWHNTAWQRYPWAEAAYEWLIDAARSASAEFVVGSDLARLHGDQGQSCVDFRGRAESSLPVQGS